MISIDNLKEYFPLYIGCRVLLDHPEFTGPIEDVLVGINPIPSGQDLQVRDSIYRYGYDKVKLVLRKLEDMTDEEKMKYQQIYYVDNHFKLMPWFTDIHFQMTRHWLKDGFDLFLLIDAGLAVDAKTLIPKTPNNAPDGKI